MDDTTFNWILGLFCGGVAAYLLIVRNLRVGIGGGRTAGNPLFTIRISGKTAVILGVIYLINAVMAVSPVILTFLFTVDQAAEVRYLVLGIVFLSTFISPIVQAFLDPNADPDAEGLWRSK